MKNVRDILNSKANAKVCGVGPEVTVVDALKVMADNDVGALLVLQDGKPVGIFSERDYARKIALFGRSSLTTYINDVMTANPISVSPADTMEFCMELVTNKHIRHLPVIENGQLVGLISIGDLVKNIIEDQRAMIQQLEMYVRGETY